MSEVCRHCGREIEDKADPCMSGRQAARWVHVPGRYRFCFPQRGQLSPWAEPAERAH